MTFVSTLRAALVALSLCVVGAAAIARSAPLADPPSTAVPVVDDRKPLALDDVRRAVLHGGERRGWQRIGEKPGVLTLELRNGRHDLVVDVVYELGSYAVHYKSSENLEYKLTGDKATVHPHVNAWMADLDEHIRREILAVQNRGE